MISNKTVILEEVLSKFEKLLNRHEEDKIKFSKTVEQQQKTQQKEHKEKNKRKLFGKSSEKQKRILIK